MCEAKWQAHKAKENYKKEGGGPKIMKNIEGAMQK